MTADLVDAAAHDEAGVHAARASTRCRRRSRPAVAPAVATATVGTRQGGDDADRDQSSGTTNSAHVVFLPPR